MIADLIPNIAGLFAEEDRPYIPRPSLIQDPDARCLRQRTYHALGIPGDRLSDRAYLTLDFSLWVAELTLDWLRKSPFKVESCEMHVNCDLGLPWLPERTCGTIAGGRPCHVIIPPGHIAGHIDAILRDPDGRDWLLEHKAINRYRFDEIVKGARPFGYISQTCCYSAGLRPAGADLAGEILLVCCKDTSRYYELVMCYEPRADQVALKSECLSDGHGRDLNETIPGILAAAAAWFAKIESQRAANSLPPRPFALGTPYPCGYCRWEKLCWAGFSSEQAVARAEDLSDDPAAARALSSLVERRAQEKVLHTERESLESEIRSLMEARGLNRIRVGNLLAERKVHRKSESIIIKEVKRWPITP